MESTELSTFIMILIIPRSSNSAEVIRVQESLVKLMNEQYQQPWEGELNYNDFEYNVSVCSDMD